MLFRFRSVASKFNYTRRYDLVQHLFFASLLLATTLGLVYSDWLQRVDLLIYDAHQQYLSRPVPDDIIIVSVDEYSLSELGRWPWPRSVHARLIDKLSGAGSKAVVLDIIFAEPDLYDPEGDHLLAQAIQRNENVILPVLFEQRYIGGQLIETLPLPELTENAHSLGHVHIELDVDGIARSLYLKEGVGDAYWSHLSVSLLALVGVVPAPLPGTVNPLVVSPVPNMLQRNHHVMVPYAGPPGHFMRISYAKFFETPELSVDMKALLKDKIIFVGATAFGLGDFLPTPVSALNHPMAGVEINANIFDALRQGLIIEPVTLKINFLISALIALLPVLLFPRLSPRAALVVSGILIISTLALTTCLLTQYYLWFPPASSLLVLMLAYPVWSWRRLEYANRFLSQELTRLNKVPVLLAIQDKDIESVMVFVKSIMPIKAWSLYQGGSICMAHWGECLFPPPSLPQFQNSAETWHQVQTKKGVCWLGVVMSGTQPITVNQRDLILDIIEPYIEESSSPTSSIELFEERIMQVQEAENRILIMRRFLDDSFNQMADGILVINNVGQLAFINTKALSYLNIDIDPKVFQKKQAIPLLESIYIDGADQWPHLLAKTLIDASITQSNGQTSTGLDLFIQITPLSLEKQHIDGVIINLSDISHIRASERQRLETLNFLSHDLRSPLVSLLAMTEMEKNKTNKVFLERVEMYATRTLTLAEDFLQVSQLEYKIDLQFGIVDIGIIVANSIDAAWDDSTKKNIHIIDNVSDNPIYVKGDPVLLERALLNLLNNAIKYSKEGAVIKVVLKIENKILSCCVEDTGFGIPGESLNKVFDRYFRIDSPDNRNILGSGLGLSFVKLVMENHHGSVTVKSKVGEGSVFCILLACVQVDDSTVEK